MSSKTPSLDRSSWLEQRKLINSRYLVKTATGPFFIDDNTRSELINESVSTPGEQLRLFFRKQSNFQKSISSIHDSTLDQRSLLSFRGERALVYPKTHKHSYIDMEILKNTVNKYNELNSEPLIYYPKKRSNTAADLYKYVPAVENESEHNLIAKKSDETSHKREGEHKPKTSHLPSRISLERDNNSSEKTLSATNLNQKKNSYQHLKSISIGILPKTPTIDFISMRGTPSQKSIKSPQAINSLKELYKRDNEEVIDYNKEFLSKHLLQQNINYIVEKVDDHRKPISKSLIDGFDNEEFNSYLKKSFMKETLNFKGHANDLLKRQSHGPVSSTQEENPENETPKPIPIERPSSKASLRLQGAEIQSPKSSPSRKINFGPMQRDSFPSKQDEFISPTVKLRKSLYKNSRRSLLAQPKFLKRKSTIVTAMQQLDVGHLLNKISAGGAVGEDKTVSVLKIIKSNNSLNQYTVNNSDYRPEKVELKRIRDENQDTINFLKRKLDVYLSETLLNDNDGLAKVTSRVLSFEELDYVKERCYERKLNQYNLQNIDTILSKLNFFRKFNQGVRLSILDTCNWIFFPANQVVFKQGESGDLIYIIIKGSVKILIEKKTKHAMVERFVVNSLYDGDHFGDLAMIGAHLENPNIYFAKSTPRQGEETKIANRRRASSSAPKQIDEEADEEEEEDEDESDEAEEDQVITENTQALKGPSVGRKKNLKLSSKGNAKTSTGDASKFDIESKPKRPATVETMEDSFMISIQREKYQDILLNILQIELEKKLSVLIEVDFLQDEQTYSLLPLASNLKTRHYKLGEAIVRVGDPLKNFFIISHGKCEVIHPKQVKVDLSSKRRKKLNKGFSYKDVIEMNSQRNIELEEEEEIKLTSSKKNITKEERELLNNMKTRDFPKSDKSIKNGVLTYTEHVVLGHLDKGSYFCGRALFSRKEYEEKEKLYPKFNWRKMREQCLMSVLADDPVVEIYSIDLDGLEGIPKELKDKLINPHVTKQEFDQYDIEKEIDFKDTWVQFKKNVVEESLRDKNLNRDKNMFRKGHMQD